MNSGHATDSHAARSFTAKSGRFQVARVMCFYCRFYSQYFTTGKYKLLLWCCNIELKNYDESINVWKFYYSQIGLLGGEDLELIDQRERSNVIRQV